VLQISKCASMPVLLFGRFLWILRLGWFFTVF